MNMPVYPQIFFTKKSDNKEIKKIYTFNEVKNRIVWNRWHEKISEDVTFSEYEHHPI